LVLLGKGITVSSSWSQCQTIMVPFSNLVYALQTGDRNAEYYFR